MTRLNRAAIDLARRDRARVFYEPETETIRTCPENYCILARDGSGRFRPFIDAAIQGNKRVIMAAWALAVTVQ